MEENHPFRSDVSALNDRIVEIVTRVALMAACQVDQRAHGRDRELQRPAVHLSGDLAAAERSGRSRTESGVIHGMPH